MSATGRGPEVLYEEAQGVGIVTFNRPEVRNALTFGVYERLAEICANATAGGPVKVLLITGAGGKAFAAGTDISLFRSFRSGEDGLSYEKSAERHFTAITNCAVPTIAAIAGACTGGGAAIAACCDVRIAAADMAFGFPIARTLGNLLSAATLKKLTTELGAARVKSLLLTARLMKSDEALASGFISEVLPDHESLLRRARELAAELTLQAPLTMRATKELMRRNESGAKVEDDDWVARVYGSADFREGFEAFLAKRKPRWQGK
ncbi:MAG: enoyl-CoA hydratase [Hyphomicrobiaceae bacterium]|nr:MAG: enoyl-CoA hydratase [Hyphomicrobiaceae bacterium]